MKAEHLVILIVLVCSIALIAMIILGYQYKVLRKERDRYKFSSGHFESLINYFNSAGSNLLIKANGEHVLTPPNEFMRGCVIREKDLELQLRYLPPLSEAISVQVKYKNGATGTWNAATEEPSTNQPAGEK